MPAIAALSSGFAERAGVFCTPAGSHDNHQIAERLVISEATVKTHINNIFAKLAVTDRSQVVVYAYRHGLANR